MALPFLPGYPNAQSTRVCKNFPKSQQFVVRQGVRRTDEYDTRSKVKAPADGNLLPPFGEKDIDPIGGRSYDMEQVLSKKPDWVEYDRQVLRYYAYTLERVLNMREEVERIRKYVIYYYLADKSIQILECREENSGIPQGAFLKRHRIAKTETEFLNEHDFKVGGVVRIYGSTFYIVDADPFSRTFMKEKHHEDLAPACDYPADCHTIKQKQDRTHVSAGLNPIRQYVEETLGAPSREQQKRTFDFLAHDREVLAFECQWNDTALFGEKRSHFRLMYYLADKTVQVFEPHKSHMRNSGRDPFPTLLTRRRLPKRVENTSIPLIGHNDVEYYLPEDLHVGQTVNVYGRDFLITRASDDYTKNWYKHNCGRTDADFAEIDDSVSFRPVPEAEPAPHSGFGTEEDSLSSCKSLRPKPPRKDIPKMLSMDKKELRLEAKFDKPCAEDVNRRFILTYYLSDDTVSIFEKPGRNTGFVCGKFLERGKYKNPATRRYFAPHEFVVGELLVINAHEFRVIDEDEATRKLKREYGIMRDVQRS